MFKPYTLKKNYITPKQTAVISIAQNPPTYQQIIKKLCSFFLITSSILILSMGVVKPYLKSSIKSLINRPFFKPAFSISAIKADNFEFMELQKFQKTNYNPNRQNIPEWFYLTIPKLGIENALVKVNDVTLDPVEFLGHYYNTALPGERGNSFIYGHSTWEEYYDPKNYKTIFSTLHHLTIGDTFTIKLKDKTLNYIVVSKKILYPEDVNPYETYLSPTQNKSFVTLMTCDPPGRKDYRLLVIGSLTN